MVTMIVAICANPQHHWVALGHTRETAEESYTANGYFWPKPLYRIVVRPKRHSPQDGW